MVTGGDALSVLNKCVDRAKAAATSSSAGDGGDGKETTRSGLFYAEFLMYCVLSALPWGLRTLHESHKEETNALLSSVEDYMTSRSGEAKNNSLSLYKDGYSELKGIGEPCSTSGIVGHVGWMWSLYKRDQEAVAEGSTLDWSSNLDEASFPFPVEPAKSGGDEDEDEAMKDAPPSEEGIDVEFPVDAGSNVERFALSVVPYCSFLPEKHVRLGKSSLNQLVVQEYVLDLITLLNKHMGKLVDALLSLPVQLQYQSVLAEAVFAHMLQLPAQQFAPMYYYGVISDLCLKMEKFPMFMSACVRYAVEKIDSLDLEATQRLSRWQAYHLSAFQFQWPWERWGWTAFPTRKENDRCRIYIEDLFVSLQRLAYHEHITSKVPPELHGLVSKSDVKPNKQIGGGGKEGEGEEGEESVKNVDMMSQLIYKKTSADDFLMYLKSSEKDMSAKFVVMAIFCIGGKSFTHMRTLLGRYRKVIDHFLSSENLGILEVLYAVWSGSPEKFMMAFTCIIEAGIINDVDALKWALESGEIVRGRGRVQWAVVESSLTACANLASSKSTAAGEKEYYALGLSDFWSKMIQALEENEKKTTSGADGAWQQYSLQYCHALARKKLIPSDFDALVSEKCNSDLVRSVLLAADYLAV